MSKGLRTAAFEPNVARARLTRAGLPIELRTASGPYLLERAPTSLRLTLEAPTLARLFIDAALAMSDQVGEPSSTLAGGEAHQVSVVAADAEQLLAAWLGELVYCARQTTNLFSTINVRHISPRHLRAELGAERQTRWLIDPMSISIADARVTTFTDSRGKRFIARIRLALLPARGS